MLLAPVPAPAVPGPDSVVVVANARVPASLALAERYRAARQVPAARVCPLDLTDAETLSLAEWRTRGHEPLLRCLDAVDARARVEAAVLMRGLPLRVELPSGARVALAAALGTWLSTVVETGEPLLGLGPGHAVPCGAGQTCLGPAWENPFRRGVFEPGWSAERQGVRHRPLLVTMLHGRSFADAARLVASATTAEAGVRQGTFLFMDGADPARGVLDGTADQVIARLRALGADDAERAPFAPDREGLRLSSFVTGTAALGRTIEGSEFVPGAVVDNVTSFGAVPENFRESGEETQVSIARWVAKGVAGVHGTTDEPLNGCFPRRAFVLDHAEGGTLAESYARNLPFVYWHNLVLGDPMAAPHAVRPIVRFTGLAPGAIVAGSAWLGVEAEDPLGRRIGSVRLLIDGREVGEAEGDRLALCAAVPGRADVQLLAVAQVADDGSPGGRHQPKGWAEVRISGRPGPDDCSAPSSGGDGGGGDDAGHADAGGGPGTTGEDAGTTSGDAEVPGGDAGTLERGCRCDAGARAEPLDLAGLALLLAAVGLERARVRPGRHAGRTDLRRGPGRHEPQAPSPSASASTRR